MMMIARKRTTRLPEVECAIILSAEVYIVKRLVARLSSLVLFCALGAAAFGQSLATTTNKTVVDGVVTAAEYSYSKTFQGLTLYANRTADALYLAVVGETTGWVAVGLGSMRMDGSTIFMGFVGPGNKVQFKVQAGSGHTHQDAPADVAASVVSYALKEAAGKTTLELQLKPAAYFKAGQASLDTIYAMGTEKSFIPRHFMRGAISIPLAR